MTRVASAGLRKDHIRARNQSAVLNAIHRHGAISRTDLALELQLSPAAITVITGVLIEQGLVFESQQGVSSTVGRKPILLEVNYDRRHVLGAKIAPAAVTMVLTNLRAQPLQSITVGLERHDVDTVLGTLEGAARRVAAAAGIDLSELAGFGASLPGIVENRTGHVRNGAFLGWHEVPFAKLMTDRLGVPVLAENDVNALAAAEAWFGSGAQVDAFLVVTLGRGVGLGIVIDGEVYCGPHGGAGEFGHAIVPSPWDASASSTIEALLADGALLERVRARGAAVSADAGPEELTARAQEGDADVLAVLEEAGGVLGVALSTLVNIFAPQLVVIAGEGVRNAPFMLPAARRELRRHAFGDLGARVEIVVDAWGDDAWARGAAGLAAARFLQEAATPIATAAVTRGGASGRRH